MAETLESREWARVGPFKSIGRALRIWVKISLALSVAAIVGSGALYSVGSASPVAAEHGFAARCVSSEELGRGIFSDRMLSADGQLSCDSCHKRHLAFTDGYERSLSRLRIQARNAPSLKNIAAYRKFGWDGRSGSIEGHIRSILRSRVEFAADDEHLHRVLTSHNTACKWLAVEDSMAIVSESLTDYLKSEFTRSTVFAKKKAANTLSPIIEEGAEKFRKLGCATCHSGDYYTNEEFYDIGLPRRKLIMESIAINDQQSRFRLGHDYGRGNITSNPDDLFAFRTPSLLNVALTAPYMHDGTFRTLEEVIDFYSRRRVQNGEAGFTSEDKRDLIAFLEALTDNEIAQNR